MPEIAYLGPPGTFSENAVLKYLKISEKNLKPLPADSIFQLFEWIGANEVEEILVPIENSIEGAVPMTLDMMVQSEAVVAIQEIILPVQHCLLGQRDAQLNQIEEIVSHPQALSQCHGYLQKTFPKARLRSADSTAAAVRELAPGIAAVGDSRLAQLYGLKILAVNINDFKTNMTRFEVLARCSAAKSGEDKTSIIFSTLRDRPGGLVEVLSEFSSRNINLTKISSRPTKEVLGDYLFFIDCEGHVDDTSVREALETVKMKSSFFKWLGSYRKDPDFI